MASSPTLSRRSAVLRLTQWAGLGWVGLNASACGFKLRGSQNYAFASIAITPHPADAVAAELRNALAASVQVLPAQASPALAQLALHIQSEQREKAVVGINASGQVREFQLRIRVKFSLTTAKGKEILVNDEILQQRDFSYNESAALAKEAEEAMLYRDMQSDIVQQLMRRLAAVKSDQLDAPLPLGSP